MPTTGSAEAFKKLLEARNRLLNVTAELNAAYPTRTSPDAKAKYAKVQLRWEKAYRAFEIAGQEFSATLKESNTVK